MGMLMSISENMFVRQVVAIDLAPSSDQGYTNENDNIHYLGDICYRTTFLTVLQEKIKSVLLESDPQEIYYPRSRQSFGGIGIERLVPISGCYNKKLSESGIISPQDIKSINEIGIRQHFFKTFPSNAIMAEIGVDEGGTARDYILPIVSPKKLYLIDPWDLSEENVTLWPKSKQNREKVIKMFSGDERVEIVQDYSDSAAEKFDNGYFDCVSSDWALEYGDAKKELIDWLPKIKRGGYLTGDTLCLESSHWSGAFGATLEFLLKYVVKRPDLLRKEKERRTLFIHNLKKEFVLSNYEDDDYNIYTKNHPFSDVLLQTFGQHYGDHEIIYQIKPSLETLKTLADSKWFKYFPSPRERAGTYSIEVGDWAENLDIEEIKKDMTIDFERQDGYAYVSQ